MELPRYQISTNEDQTVFKFISDGPKGKITKIVLYQPMNEIDLYNLALGDLDHNTGEIDFDSKTNNRDRNVILATVSETVYGFLFNRPYCSIHFRGSDTIRTRLYQMAISNYFDELSEDFEIQGKLKHELLRFKKGVNYEAFIIQLKNK
jgi:hypothetical protein